MKLPRVIVVSFFLLVAVLQLEGKPLTTELRKGEWTRKRPFQAIGKKFIRKMFRSPVQKSKYRLQFVNLSEELGGKPDEINYPSTLTYTPSPAVKKNKIRDNKNKNIQLFSQDINGIWGPGVNMEKDKNPKSSLLRFVLKRLIQSRRTKSPKNIKKVKASSSPLLAVPVEPDSYLKALEESRIPCQSLQDPTNCDDFSQLFKPFWSYNYDTSMLLQNQGLSPASIYNEYSSSLQNVIDPSQTKLIQPSTDSNNFLSQKPILFLSPNIKFTIYHHSPTIDSSDDEKASPSFDMVVEADSPSTVGSSIQPQTPPLDSLTEMSGLNVIGPLTTMKVVPN